jgi:hypothetical protein
MITNPHRVFQSLLLIALLLAQLTLFPKPVQAQYPVIVTVGQPNIWSLEQAHYLLAQIRERNLGIRNPLLSEADLDPNATNANRLDALRTLFEIGVSYDQRLGLTNSVNRQNLEYNQNRRQELLTRRAALYDQKNGYLESVGKLQSELNALEEAEANAETKKQKTREIASLKDQISATDDQLKNVSNEMELVGTGSEQLSSPSPQVGPGPFADGLTNRIGKAITDDFAKDAARNARLAASVKLDNYVQMQYELLAKQLTLLRDEVGPNERLIFLELPTSISSTPGRADDWSAQSTWEVTGYYCENKSARKLTSLRQQLVDLSQQLQRDSSGKGQYEQYRLLAQYNVQQRGINKEIANVSREFYEERAESLKRGGVVFGHPEDVGDGFKSINAAALFELGDIRDLHGFVVRLSLPNPLSTYFFTQLTPATQAMLPNCLDTPDDNCRNILVSELNSRIMSGVSLYNAAAFAGVLLSPETRLLGTASPTGEQLVRFNRLLIENAFPREIAKRRPNEARVIDLIPRQSSLNVSDIKEIVKERGAKLVFSFLMGIGGSINYQQRRERFEQFQQQEVYAAGFGKGEESFGWNFAPMPGTKRLGPGVRTTYAVMIVPRDAAKIQIKATARPYRTKDMQPYRTELTGEETFNLEIPNGPSDEGFFVTRIDYPLVAVNQRSVVVLRGDFSTQTGILINGTPLTRTVGVASPWFGSEKERPFSSAGLGEPDTTIKGFYEVINSNQLIMTFLMPKDFKGTPQIALVSPGRARTLNDISLNINGEPRQRLNDYHEGYMIGSKAKEKGAPLTIAGLEVSPEQPVPSATPTGFIKAGVNLKVDGLKDGDPKIYFNAQEIVPIVLGRSLYHLQIQLPLNLEKISFVVVKGDEVDTEHLDNPVFAKTVVTQNIYELVDEENPDDDIVILTIEGRRITDLEVITDSAYSWKGRSFNQGVLVVKGLRKPLTVVHLRDKLTLEELAPIEIYRQPPKPKPKPANSQTGGNRPSGEKR